MSAALSMSLCMLSRVCGDATAGVPRILVVQCCRDKPGQYIACMNAIFSAQRLGVMIDGLSVTAQTSAFIEQVCLHLRPTAAAISALRTRTCLHEGFSTCIVTIQKYCGQGRCGTSVASDAGGWFLNQTNGQLCLADVCAMPHKAADTKILALQAADMTDGLYLRARTSNAMMQYLLTCFASARTTRAHLLQPRAKGLTFRATCFCHRRVIDVGFVCSSCLSVFCEPQKECMTCGTVFGASAQPNQGADALASAEAAGEPSNAAARAVASTSKPS